MTEKLILAEDRTLSPGTTPSKGEQVNVKKSKRVHPAIRGFECCGSLGAGTGWVESR
jgi:hypothetical protein